MYCSQKLGEDFANFCGLLRLYELYRCAPVEPSANKVLVQDKKEPIFATRARLEPTTYLQLFSKLQVNQKIESKTGRTHYNYLVNLDIPEANNKCNFFYLIILETLFLPSNLDKFDFETPKT